MLCIRRWTTLFGTAVAGVFLVALLTNLATGQLIQPPKKVQPGPGPAGTAAGYSSVRIIESGEWRRVINVGRDCIKDKDWKQASEALQAVLREQKDHYVKITDTDVQGKEFSRWTSVKFEANNLIGSMPLEGLQEYEFTYGKEAKDQLEEAKAKGNREQLEQIAQKYYHTKAGIEANEILATLYLARGQVFTAALRFEKLLALNPERTKLSDMTLYKAALAFRRAGDTKNYDDTWKRLETSLQAKPGLKVGANVYPVAKLQEVLNESAVVDIVNLHDWPMIRGNLTNTAQANGSPPLLDTILWKRPLFKDKLEGFNDEDNDQASLELVNKAIDSVSNTLNAPVLPGFFPIASQNILVYRSHRDVRAIALKDIDVKDTDGTTSRIKQGQILWKTLQLGRSLSVLLDGNRTRVKTESWISAYQQVPGYTSFLYDNTVTGTLSTDHRLVYAIDDLAVPPIPVMFQGWGWNNAQLNPGPDLEPLLRSNELHAYDLLNGKRIWDLNADTPEFKDSHFLGQPISVGGKLYVLNEKVVNFNQNMNQPGFPGGMPNQFGGESELRLICIDPTKVSDGKPVVFATQTLGNVMQQDRFIQDPRRRMNAVHLGFGEGILVCPTNAGEVFGIDLMTRSLVWSYPYREATPPPIYLPNQPNMQFQPVPFPNPKVTGNMGPAPTFAKWKSAPPAIQDGKVVFTAPDAESIHCINLRDGKPVWKRPQSEGGGDQYMAGVFQGRVLVVGKNNIRALNLKDGTQMWSIYTGDMPSGQGVASKGIYYLPLKKGEILAIDIVRGQVKAHNRSAVPGAAPGNLVFYEGMVLSQTPHEVVAYPQLIARLEAAKVDSANDPENLAKMTDYGELLLKDGQVHLATETLLKVYDRAPPPPIGVRARDRLFEALTDLMQVDFEKASKDYLAIYKTLCTVPGNAKEEQSRKAKYFRLVGQGREAQGNLVEAFQMYKDFGALQMHRDEGGIPSLEDPNHKTPVNVWLRGRIAGMFAKATPVQREPLEAKIAEEWKLVEAKKDPNEIRSFVGMFDIPFKVGREARIKLAETIMERNDRPAYLEAELYLHQVMGSEFRTDPQIGGRALAALALLEEKKGTIDSMRLAASYYRKLSLDFGNTPVRGPKTGTDLLNELATDKRFLPFLEEAGNPWGPAKIAARTLPAGTFTNIIQANFVMSPEGDTTPFARQHRLLLDPGDSANPRLRLHDITTNQDRWTANLGNAPMNQNVFYHMYTMANNNQAYYPNARFRFFHVKGHLLVCQVGVMIYCLDGDTGTKLWEMQTVDNIPNNNGLVQLQQVMNDTEGNPELFFWNQLTNQRFRVTMGRIGSVQASYVAVLGHKGLIALDPLRGTTMWKKSDVAVNSHVFGDDQYLFLVEGTENGGLGAARTLRAADGEVLKVPDFSNEYQGRIRVLGRQILTAHVGNQGRTVGLYDILSGKYLWSKTFTAGSIVLQTEDPDITGIIEPSGKVVVLDVRTGKELVNSSVVGGGSRITIDHLKGLHQPILLSDSERFYIALNQPIGGKIGGNLIHNNFSNGTRCHVVNGWLVALYRHDGTRKAGDKVVAWKQGELAWHSFQPILNQMIVLDQFEQNPIILFTARYNEFMPNGGNRWVSVTQSLNKSNGKWVYDGPPAGINFAPMFSMFQIDLKSRTINLISYSESVQHYVDDGKGPPPLPQGAMLNQGINQPDQPFPIVQDPLLNPNPPGFPVKGVRGGMRGKRGGGAFPVLPLPVEK